MREDAAIRVAPTATINLPESLITQLVEMRSQAGDLAYRQKLNDAAMKAKAAMLGAELQSKQDRARFERLSRTNQTGQPVDPVVSREDIYRLIVTLKTRMSTLASEGGLILKTMEERNLNPSSVLYRLDGPAIVIEQGTLSWRQIGLWFAGSIMAGMALGVVWSLAPQRQREPSAHVERTRVAPLPRKATVGV